MIVRRLALLLLFAAPAFAQSYTTVTATVKDITGTPYILGSYTVTLSNTTGQQPTFGGNATFQQVFSGLSLDATGKLSIVLPSVTVMQPSGLQWTFNVCANPKQYAAAFPQPTNGVCFGYTSTGTQVSGASVDLSSSFVATTIPVAAGSGTGVPPGSFSVKTFGAVGDAKHSNACIANANTTLACSDNPFVAGDVGKLVFCVYASVPTNQTSAGTKITVFGSAGSVTISNAMATGGGVTVQCTWFTQDDTTAFQAATIAALAALSSIDPNFGSPTLALPGNVYVPPGGYAVSGNIFNVFLASGNTKSPGFIGAGSGQVLIYPRSDTFTSGSQACLMNVVQGSGFTISGFQIWGSNFGFSCTSANPFIIYNTSVNFTMRDVLITAVGNTGSASSILDFLSVQNANVELVNQQGSSINNASNTALLRFRSSSGIHGRNNFQSNNANGPNVIFNASGARNAVGQQFTWESGGSDECGGGASIACAQVVAGSAINFIGGAYFGEPTAANTGALTVDATSQAWLTSVNIGPFNTASNSNGLGIASGGFVYATGSHIRGGGTTGPAISAPAGATFVDDGGNFYQRCNGTTCTSFAAADVAAGFTGGIVPKSSLTHTPNTCYAVTGNLLATAQNLCIILLDQNYQLLTITAQSGGTTPANSACATPPVITISDGTRSATMTMTSGKTQWFSNVDAVTNINQVFANATTLTVSIGANTCATPPVNVSVNYDLQSVINQ